MNNSENPKANSYAKTYFQTSRDKKSNWAGKSKQEFETLLRNFIIEVRAVHEQLDF